MDIDEVRKVLATDDEEARHEAVGQIPVGGPPEALALLVEAMGDDSWRVRKEVVSRIAAWPRPLEAAEVLIEALGEESNVARRNAAVEALGVIGRPAVPQLLSVLPSATVTRKLVVDALGLIGDARAVEPLSGILSDPDPNLRAAAAEALGHLGRRDCVPQLVAALDSGDLLTRLAALEALNRLGVSISYVTLAPLLKEPVLRRATMEALGFSGDAQALPEMIVALGDRARGAREAAATALEALHAMVSTEAAARIEASLAAAPSRVLEGLGTTLASESRTLRRAAAALLGWARRPETLRALVGALSDDGIHDAVVNALVGFGAGFIEPFCALSPELDAELRARVFELLPRFGSVAVDGRLCTLLAHSVTDDDLEPASAAARALGIMGQGGVLPNAGEIIAALFQALSRDGQVAMAAATALGAIGAHAASEVRTLIAAHGLSGAIGPYLCRVLGACGSPDDRALLLTALNDENAVLRRAAAEALGRLGAAPDVTRALIFALSDESVSVRAAAARALGTLASQEAVPALAAVALGRLGDGGSHDDEPVVRAAAIRALGAMNDRAAVAPLRALAQSGDGSIASAVVDVVGRLATPEDEPLLQDALEHDDTEVVKAAVRALGECDSQRALDAVCECLSHARWDVRAAAAEVLSGRHDRQARAALQARLEHEQDELVRQTISDALDVRR